MLIILLHVLGNVTGVTAELGLNKCHFVCQEGDAGSIADMLRATAEEAMTQTGFIFDETTGMYYDHSTGFYYDSVGPAASCYVVV